MAGFAKQHFVNAIGEINAVTHWGHIGDETRWINLMEDPGDVVKRPLLLDTGSFPGQIGRFFCHFTPTALSAKETVFYFVFVFVVDDRFS